MKTKFSIITVYKSVLRQELFDICIGTKNKVRNDVGLQEIVELFQEFECTNAVLVKHKDHSYFVRAKAGHHIYFKSDTRFNPTKSVKKMYIYTGEPLRNYIHNSGVLNFKARDFVKSILFYATDEIDKRVFGLSGLWCTGKTTGFLQSCALLVKKNIATYDNIAYITFGRGTSSTVTDIYNLLENRLPHVRYVFLDEVTFIKQLPSTSGILYDVVSLARGVKIFVSGTDSYTLSISERDSAFHRIILQRITFINYFEARRTMGLDFREYAKFGGLYKTSRFNDVAGLDTYVNTAVVDNIFNSLSWSSEKSASGDVVSSTASRHPLYGVSHDKISKIVFSVLYSIMIDSSINLRQSFSIKGAADLFTYVNNDEIDVKSSLHIQKLIEANFSLGDDIKVTEKSLNRASRF